MRRTKHRRRFHTDRIVHKRQLRNRREGYTYWNEKPLADGYLEKDEWYFGCRRAHCLLCHGEKFLAPRRTREKWEWLREVEDQIHAS